MIRTDIIIFDTNITVFETHTALFRTNTAVLRELQVERRTPDLSSPLHNVQMRTQNFARKMFKVNLSCRCVLKVK